MSLESAYSLIEKLVKDFNANEKHYLASDYSESQARLDFIDKLFIALGWDVNHEHQKNPYEQEVKVERRVKDKETQKRADYAFFLSPNYRDPKFYVEAKKPSRSLANPYDYFQAIRYGWNAQTPLVVLTDFEEFHILDSRYKPDIKYTKERKVLSFHYTEYTDKEKFSKLYYLFSREAVESGSIEKFAETMPKPRGKAVQKGLFPGSYQSIDESFLEELDEIRNTLARSFKKKNPALTSEELTEATQRTIDRLVFIRFLEDMLIEGEHHISSYGDKGTAWGDFIADCRSLNAKYNGIVFKEHFIDRLPLNKGEIQKGSNTAIAPDDKDFGDICKELSHINSPYNFNSIPIHILGSIYERFLGKVVHATDKRVTIEEKPEVRKAGGVYYTPQYIVQYIVDNTVGKLIEGKTPAEITKLRFADISCGSGSFLITVYDTLLRYYSKYYQLNPKEAKADGCIFSNGLWVLSLKQKRQILINNVYGVDIDHQAVEVTQLSLYLKLLEDETLATANEMQAMFKEKILPDLSKNIICGNSLIGTDIYTNDAPLLAKEGWSRTAGTGWSAEEEKKINAMNFEDAFPAIMKNGGFDAIVGNPPYILLQILETKAFFNYSLEKYNSAKYKIDTYQLFVEKAIHLIGKNGYVGYILPNTFLKNIHAEPLRKYILTNTNIEELILFYYKVFQNASVDTAIILLSNTDNNGTKIFESKKILEFNLLRVIQQKVFEKNKRLDFNVSVNENDLELLSRLKRNNVELRLMCNAYFGIQTFDRKKYVAEYKIDQNYKPIIDGTNIERYHLLKPNEYVNFIPKAIKSGGNSKVYEQDRICIRQIGKTPICTLVNAGIYTLNTIYNVYLEDVRYDLKYILAIINSTLLKYYWLKTNYDEKETFPKVKKDAILSLPIRQINFDNKSQNEIYEKIIFSTAQMLKAKIDYANSAMQKDITFYENKCNALDRQIDRLVYELYGLTEEEIRIVEAE